MYVNTVIPSIVDGSINLHPSADTNPDHGAPLNEPLQHVAIPPPILRETSTFIDINASRDGIVYPANPSRIELANDFNFAIKGQQDLRGLVEQVLRVGYATYLDWGRDDMRYLFLKTALESEGIHIHIEAVERNVTLKHLLQTASSKERHEDYGYETYTSAVREFAQGRNNNPWVDADSTLSITFIREGNNVATIEFTRDGNVKIQIHELQELNESAQNSRSQSTHQMLKTTSIGNHLLRSHPDIARILVDRANENTKFVTRLATPQEATQLVQILKGARVDRTETQRLMDEEKRVYRGVDGVKISYLPI